MPRIRRSISATGISSITSGTMGSAAATATTETFHRFTGNERNAVTFWKAVSRSASDDTSGLLMSSLPTSSLRSHRACDPPRTSIRRSLIQIQRRDRYLDHGPISIDQVLEK